MVLQQHGYDDVDAMCRVALKNEMCGGGDARGGVGKTATNAVSHVT